MKILLTGRDGQVGFELQRALAPLGELFAFDHAACDLADERALRQVIRTVRPDVVVNPAAYTAVDRAESDIGRAEAINGRAPGIIGEEAANAGAWVVHYSTDYVFDGTKPTPYGEADATNPQSVYGRTKLQGESSLQASGARCLIFRTSWVVGAHGNNFAKTMLRLATERDSLGVVADQFGAPTPASLLADVTGHLIRQVSREGAATFPFGLYHLASTGVTTWHEYACAVLAAAQAAGLRLKVTAAQVRALTTAEYPTAARRPANSRLDTRRFREAFGLHLPDWQVGVHHVLQELLQDHDRT